MNRKVCNVVLWLVLGSPGLVTAQEALPVPKQIPAVTPRIAVIGFGNVSLASLSDIDASASGKLAIAFWPNENVATFMAFNRGAGATAADSLDLKRMLFPDAANIGFEGFVSLYFWSRIEIPSESISSQAQADTQPRGPASPDTAQVTTPTAVGAASAASPVVSTTDNNVDEDQMARTSNRLGGYAEVIYQQFKVGNDAEEANFNSMYCELGILYQYTFVNDADSRFGATLGAGWRIQSVLSGSHAEYNEAFAAVAPSIDPVYTFQGIGLKATLQVNDFAFAFDLQHMRGARDITGVTGWSGLVTTTITGSLLRFPHGKAEDRALAELEKKRARDEKAKKDEKASGSSASRSQKSAKENKK